MPFSGRFRSRLISAAVVGVVTAGLPGLAVAQQIVVQGSQRVDAETIRSYFTGADQARINEGVRALYSTGLFSDVRVRRDGARVIVQVVENSVINRVAFEGNSKVKSDVLVGEVQTRSRGPYSQATVQADVERIRDVYRRAGRGAAEVSARTVDLPNGRMDVVFTIKEGGKTGVREIAFAGNNAFSASRLRNLMQTTEMNFLSWLKNSDVYDPDRISADLEAIRRFYLKNGYADFRVVGSDARYDDARQGYVVSISVEEGAQYRVSAINIDSRLGDVPSEALRNAVKISAGDVYNGDLVEKSVDAITREVARKGYAFTTARPRGDRNPATQSIALSFVVEEGPRVYVERIVVRGNTRTRDYVVRREFELGEGDAYNRVLVDRAERRLNSLGFFKRVRITNEPGSSPDRVVVVVDVEDQPTGSFGISGGYSTQDGIIGEVSVTEANFLGRGQYVRAAAMLGQRARGVDLSFTEPYFMGYRMSGGFDLYRKEVRKSPYALYDTFTTGGTIRAGIPLTDEFSVGMRYSLYQTRIEIPNTADRPYNDCVNAIPGVTAGTPGAPALDVNNNCMTNYEAPLAIKEAAGSRLTSAVGTTFSYNTLDNTRNPTKGLYAELRTDVAGLGGDSKWVRGTSDVRYYYPVFDEVVAMTRVQGGHLWGYGDTPLRIIDNFNLGPTLVRGFAPGGIGPRDVSPGLNNRSAGLGGTSYYGGSVELQFPIFGMPREVGLRGALFADAGTLFGYKGRENFSEYLGLGSGASCQQNYNAAGGWKQNNCVTIRDEHKIRSSVGASLLWASPLGPIRFDYAFALSKDKNDVTQAFRFSGGTNF